METFDVLIHLNRSFEADTAEEAERIAREWLQSFLHIPSDDIVGVEAL